MGRRGSYQADTYWRQTDFPRKGSCTSYQKFLGVTMERYTFVNPMKAEVTVYANSLLGAFEKALLLLGWELEETQEEGDYDERV